MTDDADLTRTVGSASTGALPRGSAVDEGRFPPGTVVAQRYRIAGRLGSGGMGEVYKASDLLLGTTVALKFLPDTLAGDEATLERFRGEVRMARQVSHPNVCRVFDLGEADGQIFLSMEYIDGENLSSLLRRIGQLPQAKALDLARRLCSGLAAAHEKGILHRDLKPPNVMIDGRGQLLIADFGLAAIGGQRVADVRSGTPAYMAPEQLAGEEVTVRSDIYALGLVLFEMFSGRPAFVAALVGQLLEAERAGPPSLRDVVPEIDAAVERAVARCLEPEPRRRPASALAVAAALPGGDPLAAALNAGETPSPEMVAAAGAHEGMRPRQAVAALTVLIAGMLLAAWIAAHATVLSVVRLELPPDAMAQRARDILAALGYTAKPPYASWGFRYDRSAPQQADTRPPAVYFLYRASPRSLAPTRFARRVMYEGDPPLVEPGAISLRLDPEGRLSRLQVLPSDWPQTGPLDWTALFRAAGLDPARFTAADPDGTPPGAFDARAAWVEAGAQPPLRIQTAAWRGRPVLFRMERASAGGSQQLFLAGIAFQGFAYSALMLATCVLAWHNVRRGRGDRRGAGRASVFIFAIALISAFLSVPQTLDADELIRVLSLVGYSLLMAAMLAVTYLGFEPYVRRRWPHALIAWTRALAGSWRDPLVGRHVLIGLAAAAVLQTLVRIHDYLAGPDGAVYPLTYATSLPRIVAALLNSVIDAVTNTGWEFFVLFLLYRLTRKRWAAAAATTVLFAALWSADSRHLSLTLAFALAYHGALTLMLLRFGLLAGIAATLPRWIELPAVLDPAVCYFSASLAAMAAIAVLGLFAFRIALAGQPVFRREA